MRHGWEIPWRREWLPTPVFLPEEFHEQRSLLSQVDYSPWGCKELDMTDYQQQQLQHSFSRIFPFETYFQGI